MMRALTWLQVGLVVLVGVAIAPDAQATPRLFASSNGHSGQPPPNLPWGFYEVNSTTAAVQYQGVGNLQHQPCCNPTGWLDITGQPGNTTSLYGVAPGPGGVDWVARIDVNPVLFVTDLYDFGPADLGFDPSWLFELAGIAIDPSSPSIATLNANTIAPNGSIGSTLFDLDLGTGAISNIRNTERDLDAIFFALTYGSDGTLFTFANTGNLAIIDRSTAGLNELGPCSCGFEGLIAIEFDPARGEVLGVDANGRLLRVSPTTGGILEVLGQTGLGRFGGITGLAFVAPEPATGSLLVLGLGGLACASRRRARG